MRNILVIYDGEEIYAKKLMEYINAQKTWPFLALAFTDESSLVEYLNHGEADILLTCDLTKLIEDTYSGLTFVLDNGKEQERSDARYIYKYQSCELVVKEILEVKSFIENESRNRLLSKKEKGKITCVFSPSGDHVRDVFAFSFAKLMAEGENTLFVDMSYFSGLEKAFGIPSDRSLSDLLYFSNQKRKDVVSKLGSMTANRYGVDIVPKVLQPRDLYGTPSQSFIELLQQITADSLYEQIILDMAVPVFEIMDISDRVLIPLKADGSDEASFDSFSNTILNSRFSEIGERIEKVYPPIEDGRIDPGFFEGLLYGDYGKWLKSLC